MVHQVAVGFENFEDFLMEKMLKKVLNADLSLILGRDGGPTPVSREVIRKIIMKFLSIIR